MIGYKHNLNLLKSGYRSVLPELSARSYEIYKDCFR
jgi:hypothetical protein